MMTKRNVMAETAEEWSTLTEQRTALDSEIESKKQLYIDTLKDLGICPTCGSEINENNLLCGLAHSE